MAILAQVWTTHFEHVLEAVLRALQHADDKLREQAAALGVGVGVGVGSGSGSGSGLGLGLGLAWWGSPSLVIPPQVHEECSSAFMRIFAEKVLG